MSDSNPDASRLPIDPALHVPSDNDVYGTSVAPQSFDLPLSDLNIWDSGIGESIRDAVAAELERIEYAVRGAIIAGYDGVDVRRSWNPYRSIDQIEAIVPWKGEPPEPGGDYRTDRYAWPWFDNNELAEIARTGKVRETIRGGGDD